MNTIIPEIPEPETGRPAPRKGGILKKLLPVILILAVGVAGGMMMKRMAPEIRRKPPEKMAPAVDTVVVQPGTHQSAIEVMGVVAPDRQISLKSRVSGDVVEVSPDFVVGGVVKKGAVLLRLDDSDYRIERLKARSALEKALAALALEQGNQSVARAEMELIQEAGGHELPVTDLALRKPQLAQARAAVESARADLEKADLNLARTRMIAPFNALITEKNVELGMSVAVQSSLCTLVDTDLFIVEAKVPPDRLEAIDLDSDGNGSDAEIHSSYSNASWNGRAVRRTGRMSDGSRLAGVIIEVTDPLGLSDGSRPPMLLDDHVAVHIMGHLFSNVVAVPRSAVRGGDNVWIYKDGRLEIRKITSVWKEDGRVFVSSGIQPGDHLITSDLSAPVPGMSLQNGKGSRTGS